MCCDSLVDVCVNSSALGRKCTMSCTELYFLESTYIDFFIFQTFTRDKATWYTTFRTQKQTIIIIHLWLSVNTFSLIRSGIIM